MPINFFRKLENTVLKSVQKPLMDREGTSSSKNDFDIATRMGPSINDVTYVLT